LILPPFVYICANNPGFMIKAPQIFLFIFLLCLGSCVPVKRLTYLQEQENTSDQDLIALQPSIPPYRLQVNDLLSIRIKALDQ
jgi:polysaccharide export outer membrane protein